jgi:hypothetical protein
VSTLKLHDMNNPQQLVLVDSKDISTVESFNGHSAILPHAGFIVYVDESTETVYNLMMEGDNETH